MFLQFTTEESALAAAERIHNSIFPPEHGGALHVEFLPTNLVDDLIKREKHAWMNGRQKLVLEIKRNEGDAELTFGLVAPGPVSTNGGASRSAPIGYGAGNPLTAPPPPIPPAGRPGGMAPRGAGAGPGRRDPMSQIRGQLSSANAAPINPRWAAAAAAAPAPSNGRPGAAAAVHTDRLGFVPGAAASSSSALRSQLPPGMKETRCRPVLLWRENRRTRA